jgi:hypothetical protein
MKLMEGFVFRAKCLVLLAIATVIGLRADVAIPAPSAVECSTEHGKLVFSDLLILLRGPAFVSTKIWGDLKNLSSTSWVGPEFRFIITALTAGGRSVEIDIDYTFSGIIDVKETGMIIREFKPDRMDPKLTYDEWKGLQILRLGDPVYLWQDC